MPHIDMRHVPFAKGRNFGRLVIQSCVDTCPGAAERPKFDPMGFRQFFGESEAANASTNQSSPFLWANEVLPPTTNHNSPRLSTNQRLKPSTNQNPPIPGPIRSHQCFDQ